MFKIIKYIFFLSVFTLFSACGGSDDKKSNNSEDENPTPKDLGVYIDVPANTALEVPAFVS